MLKKVITRIKTKIIYFERIFFDNLKNILFFEILGIGDWGLGIGPNPQSPIPIFH
jgi:hypothetical protein